MSEAIDVGSEIGGYRVESELGQGGMGVVYLARHVQLDRQVALKVLGGWLEGNERAAERFLRESRLAAGLEHPSIVTVYDAGEQDGRLYIAMRYVEGEDLHDRIVREGPLDPEALLDLLGQVAGALDAAHAAGLVHRDVKPSNVMLEGDRAFLTDFGLTRQIEGTAGVTKAGEFMGTIEWAAPEQIDHGELYPQTDVYALGCVLFAGLTGRTPYEGSVAEVLWSHVQGPPPQLAEHRPDLAPELQAVLDTAMAKDPLARQASAGELIAQARAACGLGPAAAGPPAAVAAVAAQPARRPSAKDPAASARKAPSTILIVAAIALVALAIAVGLFVVVGGGGEDAKQAGAYEKSVRASQTTLVKEGDAMVARGGAGGSPEAAIERFISFKESVARNADRLGGLTPPASVASDHAVMVDGYRLLEREIGDAIVAAQAGDPAALKRLEARIDDSTAASVRQIERASKAIQAKLPGG